MKIDFCTIASANYLPRVKVLQQSLKTFHPESKLHILLCEDPEIVPQISLRAEYDFISPDEICPDWRMLAFRYDVTEFNTALKPHLLEYLLAKYCDAVIYLDPDIEVYSSLQPVLALFENYDLLLTPHICSPLGMDGRRPGVDEMIRVGIYNLGFIGLSSDYESLAALRWWRDACHEYCFFDVEHRYFVDQFWAAALPAFIRRFHNLRDPGCNVAYWNIFQRQLSKADGRWLIDRRSLLFFHFSGLPDDLRLVSRHQNRITADIGSDLHELIASYCARVSQNGWREFRTQPYSLGSYSDGSPIEAIERQAFNKLSEVERASIGDPFASSAPLRDIGARLIKASRLSPAQKYFRLLAAQGVIEGHRTLAAHFAVRCLQFIKRA